MYCTHCGKQINDTSKFCQYCGEAVSITVIDTEAICNSQRDGTCNSTLDYSKINQPPIDNGRKFHIKAKHWGLMGCCSLIIIVIIVISISSGSGRIAGKVDSLLEEDLNKSVKITALYYNEEQQGCLVEFTSGYSSDVAAVYLESGEILYDSDFDYYTKKFNNATSSSERGKWSSKVLEYSDLAEWNFAIAIMKADGETEYNGWKKIK